MIGQLPEASLMICQLPEASLMICLVISKKIPVTWKYLITKNEIFAVFYNQFFYLSSRKKLISGHILERQGMRAVWIKRDMF